MGTDFSAYVEETDFWKQFEKLKKKLKKRSVLFYGAGSFFQYLNENFDFSELNVIGVSDSKFVDEDYGKNFFGYKIVPISFIKNENPDVILLSMQNYAQVRIDFELNLFRDTEIDILPLAKKKDDCAFDFNFNMCKNTLRCFFEIDWISVLKHKRKYALFKESLLKQKKIKDSELVNKRAKSLIKRLQKKSKKEKLKVCFTLHQASKWKCETLYRLMEADENFEPYILLTIPDVKNSDYPSLQKSHYEETVEFFEKRGYRVLHGYDWEQKKFLDFELYKPDIVFYQQPWDVAEIQSPLTVSRFALSFYVPYFVANAGNNIEYGLDFHLNVFRHYILNEKIKNFYAPKMLNNGKNLCVVGHPQLDYFYLNRDEIDTAEKKYVIYAPHWSINVQEENYATFLWNGMFILDYAKKHKELHWVFKPHPTLKYRLKNQRVMTDEEIDEYWKEWDSVGLCYESGDYMEFFKHSKAMITDCGSFLTEFLLTKQPVIHLVSSSAVPYNPSAEEIVKTYYQVHNLQELEQQLDSVLIKGEDTMKHTRLKTMESLGLSSCYAAKNILDDLKKELFL